MSVTSGTSYTTTSRLYDDESVIEEAFILKSKSTLYLTIFMASTAVFIAAGIVRSGIILQNSTNKLNTLEDAAIRIDALHAIEAMADVIQREGFARVKYLSSSLNPTYYPEITVAVNEMDKLFASNSREFQEIHFEAPEYREYNCSVIGFKSDLNSRPAAVTLQQHRNLDERKINPWDDVDYYECLADLLADIQFQLVARSVGFEFIWQSAVAYILVMRALWNMQIAVNYAFLTRELSTQNVQKVLLTLLKQGSVTYVREEDRANLIEHLSIAQNLLMRADQTSPSWVGLSVTQARQHIDHLLDTVQPITNATQAYALVQPGDKFEYTTTLKSAFTYLIAGKNEYAEYIRSAYDDAVQNEHSSIISEAVKLFIFCAILLPCAIIATKHLKSESKRLQARYEICVDRYADSCKAIFRLLPEPVAKKLNSGLNIRPEFFHNVTVFYSDIVGFTTICSKLTANEVLSMLNSIYTMFDSRTNAYKCYKIETIGDAYVVASGVPVRNLTHAAEISLLALALIEEVSMIKFSNKSGKQRIRVRIGISSGPVIAGIVGIKMLRYCLFGKTVLNANRMEQTSQPQKIQLSQSSFMELEKLGGFTMEQRPQHEWPDKNPTYWLTGRMKTSPLLSMFSPGSFGSAKVNLFDNEP